MHGLYASIVLGAGWAVWHIPLFFIQGYPLHDMAMTLPEHAGYFGCFFLNSILYTWIFYRTNRSTLSAIFFHFISNYAGLIFDVEPLTEGIRIGVLFLTAVTIILFNRDIFLRKD
jgi:membrane protease YdiL (CAAX protease family)